MLRLIMLCIVGLVCHPAVAQDYPSKQIKLVVQFSAGGGADLIARMIGAELQTTFNQAVVVDNRPGANGAIANTSRDIVTGAAGLALELGRDSEPSSRG